MRPSSQTSRSLLDQCPSLPSWTPTICPSPRAGKPNGLVLFPLPHDITQGYAGPLTAFSQALPVWSSWVRLPSAWPWWVATPAALPWSFHPRASPSPWWSPAGEAPACSCLSSFPETGGTKSQCSSSEYIWFFQVISDLVMFYLRSTYNTVFQKEAGLSENQNFKTR